MRKDVVVVLNYNGWDDTDACVRSLLAGSPDCDVLVVDNGSTTPFPADAAHRWPGVLTIANGENLGFTGGMNTGIRAALAQGAHTVTILNNDTVLESGAIAALATLVERAQQEGRPVAVSPEVRYRSRPQDVWFGGGAIDSATNLPHHVAPSLLAPPGPDGVRWTEVLAGCCVTASAQTWEDVGLLDERYFLNFEDSDWSVRAREAGVRLAVDTRVTIEHAVSASFTGAYSYLSLYYYTRNGLLFGRERCGGSPVEAGRFLRRHVLPSVLRAGGPREVARRCLVLGVALRDYLGGRFGPAPRGLTRRASTWAT